MSSSTIVRSPVLRKSAIAITTAIFFFCSANASPQSAEHLPPTPLSPQAEKNGVEILSDTYGIDFGAYVRRALQLIKKSWLPLIPEEAQPPGNMKGETIIRFMILPDGSVKAMHLDVSSQNANIDRAAWGGITGVGQFPPLPPEFKGPNLILRIDFFTNIPVPTRTSPTKP